MFPLKRVLVACFFLAGSRWALAQGTPGSAANMAMGQKILSSIGPAASTQLWYHVKTVAGRSYCAETGNVEGFALASGSEDTRLTIYQGDGTTAIGENDDAEQEPFSFSLSRACWMPSAAQAGDNFIKLSPFAATANTQVVSLRVVETTLFCPWFFVAGDYSAFSLIRNAANTALNGVVVTWRGLNGAVAGTTTVSVPADGGVILNARDFVNLSAFSNGTIEIAHPGSPEQLQGMTTTLSGSTGLSFDAPFTQRRPW